MEKRDQRSSFSKQPARVVLVDFTPPFDTDTCENVISALTHFFTLVCSLSGPSRSPFFGLFALGNHPEGLFPLQHVKNNFPRLRVALAELRSFGQDTRQTAWTNSCIGQGIEEATSMFQRQAQSLIQSAGCCNQLEIVIFSSQNPNKISRDAEKIARNLDAECVKKIQLVCMQNPDRLNILEEITDSSQMSHTSETSGGEITSLVEAEIIEQDVLSLENVMKAWLQDHSTDSEHLHVVLPSGDADTELIIKCDLQERIISPALLPVAGHFELGSEANNKPSLGHLAANKHSLVPVYKLVASKLFPQESICDSIVFGTPQIVRATSCWRIDWDELEANQQNFSALCHVLQEKRQVLLGHVKKPVPSLSVRNKPPEAPSGRYLLFASASNTLLIKPVAVSELMLPCDVMVTEEAPDPLCVQRVQSSFDQLESLNSYNPLMERSGLYASLSGLLDKTTNQNPPYNSRQIGNSASLGMNNKKKPLVKPEHNIYNRRFAKVIEIDDPPNDYSSSSKKPRFSSAKSFYNNNKNNFPTEL